MYTTKHLSQLFTVSPETIRVWTLEFARYLSPSAKPAQGRHRRYTDDDLQVLSLVAAMKGEALLFEDIHMALQSGQRAEPPSLSEIELTTETQPSYIERLQVERDSLLAQLGASNERAARAEGQLDNIRQQLDATQSKLEQLIRENAVLLYRLEQGED